MKMITLIKTAELFPHPENPRQDLGDLTELTESIRVNGVMQNLTVVLGHRMDKEEFVRMAKAEGVDRTSAEGMYNEDVAWTMEGYTVVIGHRRLAAAKEAGLEELPCAISDMDHRTQISTMLMENMQRADLTVYEQAKGFQMMMDLGFTPKEIGEKTGFSEKTVRDRIKFTKLNQKNFSEAVARGATLMDMIEISRLKSKSDQNEVLKEAGTNNFRQVLHRKLGDQKYNDACKTFEKLAGETGDGAFIPVPGNVDTWRQCDRVDSIESDTGEEKIRRRLKKLNKEHGQLMFKFRKKWDTDEAVMDLYELKKKQDPAELSDQQKKLREADRARQKHLREVKKLWAEAYALRTDFIRNYVVTNGCGMTGIGKLILKYSLRQQNYWNHKLPENQHWKEKYITETLGLKREEYEDKTSLFELIEARGIPQIRATLAWIMGGGVFDADCPETGRYDYYDGHYTENASSMIGERYDFLMEIGYVMSDMEMKLMDGSHPVYETEAKS